MSENIHMRFYDTNFADYDWDHEGYSDALMSLTRVRKPHHIESGLNFFAKYASDPSHKHHQLCKECLVFLQESMKWPKTKGPVSHRG